MTPETIFKTMQDLIAEQFAIEADEVTMDSSFVDDLGADSVDLVELVMAMERMGLSGDRKRMFANRVFAEF